MDKVIKIAVFLVLGLVRMQAQSDPVGDYIGNYFAMLNNFGDVTIYQQLAQLCGWLPGFATRQ